MRKKKKELKLPKNYYYREIKDIYTPAMASFIIDEEIEEKEACWATILDLEVKNHLIINRDEFNNYNIIVTKKETKNLYQHEKYILECIENANKINISIFNKYVIEDCEKYKFIVKSKSNKSCMEIILLIVITIFMLYTAAIPAYLLILGERIEYSNWIFIKGWSIITTLMFGISFFVNNETRRIKGAIFAIEMKGLKNYIRDYSLLKEKDIDNIIVTGRYLPFAVALGLAEKIEDKYMINAALETRYFGKR